MFSAVGAAQSIDLSRYVGGWGNFAALYGATAADYASTRISIEHFGYKELNPVLGQTRARQAVLMFGSTVASDFISRFLTQKKHPQFVQYTGIALRYLKIGTHTSAAIMNTRLMLKGHQ